MTNRITDYDYALKKRFQHKLLIGAICVVTIYICITLVLRFIIFPVLTESDSMNPAINEKECIFISPLASPTSIFFSENSINRGDVVYISREEIVNKSKIKNIMDSIVGFFTLQRVFPFNTKDTQHDYLRRVIGIPGDTIYVKDYQVYVKTKDSQHFLTEFEIIKDSYETISKNLDDNIDINLGVPGNVTEIKLKENEYYLLCDNRIEGIDSRLWGPIYKKQIKGKGILRYFPFNKFGKI